MKKWLIILFIYPTASLAQISIMPIVGVSSIRMSQAFGYEKGGNSGIMGAEIELNLKSRPYSKISLSLVSGVNYLSTKYNYHSVITYTLTSYNYNYFNDQAMEAQMKYWQVPLILRCYIHPLPLVEDWGFYFGAGFSQFYTMQAHLAEQWTNVVTQYGSALPPPPQVTMAQDSRDVTAYAKKFSLYSRLELGMKFKRFQVQWRFILPLQDDYFNGIENVWQVPAKESLYISGHTQKGYTKEKYSELIIGWKLP